MSRTLIIILYRVLLVLAIAVCAYNTPNLQNSVLWLLVVGAAFLSPHP